MNKNINNYVEQELDQSRATITIMASSVEASAGDAANIVDPALASARVQVTLLSGRTIELSGSQVAAAATCDCELMLCDCGWESKASELMLGDVEARHVAAALETAIGVPRRLLQLVADDGEVLEEDARIFPNAAAVAVERARSSLAGVELGAANSEISPGARDRT